jgi:hypothetical protein
MLHRFGTYSLLLSEYEDKSSLRNVGHILYSEKGVREQARPAEGSKLFGPKRQETTVE